MSNTPIVNTEVTLSMTTEETEWLCEHMKRIATDSLTFVKGDGSNPVVAKARRDHLFARSFVDAITGE